MLDRSQERLNQAIRLSQLGNVKEARRILLQLIQENSQNEYAWLWLVDVCDSDRERKAILSRGVKLNPQSKLLRTAMKRFVDTGDLESITDSLDSLIIETQADEAIAPASKPKPASKLPSDQGSDLDWIQLEEDTGEAELDTISDDEFSRLSAQYFSGMETQEEENLPEEITAEAEAEEVESPTGSDSGLFLLDELLEQTESPSSQSSKPFIDFDVLEEPEKKARPQAIEDRLKGAFGEESGKKKRRSKIKKLDFRRMSRRFLVILVSAFWLVVFVLGGLFAVNYFGLSEYISLRGQGTPTVETTAEGTIEPEAEAVDGETTPEPTQGVLASTQEAVESTPAASFETFRGNYPPISADTLSDLAPLGLISQVYPLAFSGDGNLMVVLGVDAVTLIEVGGEQRWSQGLEPGTPRFIGAGFSADGALLGLFAEDLSLSVWSVESGESINQFTLSDELLRTYNDIPYLPSSAKAQVAFSADGSFVGAAFWGGVSIWDMAAGMVVHDYSLPADILMNSFSADIDLNFVMDFHPEQQQVVYGGRENIYLIDLAGNTVLQNWKTQYVGSLEFLADGQIVEAGYPLSSQLSYIAVWKETRSTAVFRVDCLAVSRGQHLPVYAVFENSGMLVYEKETEGNVIALQVASLMNGGSLGVVNLDAVQPVLAATGLDDDGLMAVWAQIPAEGFGSSDQVQFWNVDTLVPVHTCEACSFPTGRFADSHGILMRDDATVIALYGEGVGGQLLAVTD